MGCTVAPLPSSFPNPRQGPHANISAQTRSRDAVQPVANIQISSALLHSIGHANNCCCISWVDRDRHINNTFTNARSSIQPFHFTRGIAYSYHSLLCPDDQESSGQWPQALPWFISRPTGPASGFFVLNAVQRRLRRVRLSQDTCYSLAVALHDSETTMNEYLTTIMVLVVKKPDIGEYPQTMFTTPVVN